MTDRRFIWMAVYAGLVALAVMLLGYDVNNIFFSSGYEIAGVLLLTFGFVLIFMAGWCAKARPFYYLIFLPIWLMPALRCRFKVPYIFCDLCPGKCAWGQYRSMFVPFYLLLNVDNRFWCWNLCPLGQLQDCTPRKETLKIPKTLTYVRYGILAFAAYVIYMALSYTYQVQYTLSALSLAALTAFAIASTRCHRPFCSVLCPVGAFSDVILWLRKRTGF